MSREAFDRTSPSVSKILYQGYVNDVYSKLDIARHLNVGQNHIDKFLREVPSGTDDTIRQRKAL